VDFIASVMFKQLVEDDDLPKETLQKLHKNIGIAIIVSQLE